MIKNDIFITSAVRTAVGSLGKSLKNVSAADLGSAVINKAVENSNLKNKRKHTNNNKYRK